MVPLTEHVGLTPEQRSALVRELAPLGTLQDVVQWGFSRSPPSDVAAVVVQDEYCHDVVMPWREGLHLAFDTT
jgi:hypothetical protein